MLKRMVLSAVLLAAVLIMAMANSGYAQQVQVTGASTQRMTFNPQTTNEVIVDVAPDSIGWVITINCAQWPDLPNAVFAQVNIAFDWGPGNFHEEQGPELGRCGNDRFTGLPKTTSTVSSGWPFVNGVSGDLMRPVRMKLVFQVRNNPLSTVLTLSNQMPLS